MTRFFRHVWRANAILILLAGLGTAALLTYAFISSLRRERHFQSTPVTIEEGEGAKEQARIPYFERVRGTSFLRASLYGEKPHFLSYEAHLGSPVLNYLFYDLNTHEAHWLVQRNDHLFISGQELTPPGSEYNKGDVLGFLYEYINRDTDGDSQLTGNDWSSLALSSATGTNFNILIDNIEEVRDFEVITNTDLIVFYVAAGVLRAARIDFAKQTVILDHALAVTAPLSTSEAHE